MYIVCNWKMNPRTKVEAQTLTRAITRAAGKHKKDIIIVPPFVFLDAVREIHSLLGIQDVSGYSSGAYTGQISARMAKDRGARYAIVGHSERRREQCETDTLIAQKILRAYEEKIVPIVCVGESKKMDNNRAWKEIKKHIDSIVPSLRRSKKYILAYEPVWAIGGGARVDGAYVQEMIYRIKLYMRAQTNSIPRVLYGGSVDGKFVESLLHYQSSIDGFLVGSASVRKKDIITIIKKIYGTT